MTLSAENITELLNAAAIIIGAAFIGLFLHYLFFNVMMRVMRHTSPRWHESLAKPFHERSGFIKCVESPL